MPFVGQRPGSDPQQRHSRPVSPASNGSSESPTLLDVPAVQLSEKVEQLTQDEVRQSLYQAMQPLCVCLVRRQVVGGNISRDLCLKE